MGVILLSMKTVDLMLSARWVVPIEPSGAVLENHSLVIHDGRIVALVPTDQALTQFQPAEHQQFVEHALMPGLVNAHTHSPMTLLRGVADDMPLYEWLQQHIWPMEARHVSEEFAHDGSLLALAEQLRGGTTCFNDMYFFPEVTAKVTTQAGMRGSIGLLLIDFASAWASDANEYIQKGLDLYDSNKTEPLLSFCFAPHAPYSVSEDNLRRIKVLADELDLPIHMHVHETAQEVNEFQARFGMRPLEKLAQLGISGPNFLAVHMTQLTDAEIDFLAESGTHVLHCPEASLKLASGFCPVHRLQEAGVNVAIGTDGTASNNDLDMFGEMRTAALLGKGVSGNAAALPAETTLRMATLNSAVALGLADEIGSLVPGKAADVIAVDLSELESQPMTSPISHLVYAVGRHQVSDVWVAGRQLLRQRRLTSIDEADLRARIIEWQKRIAAARH
ncbi:5-methylthioadenosine/S-adenosylhomocysteine deaminase [Ectothiorhodosinus mongolicus]|uniref:5-methylthioadenosine/S-adenosylhomocysteine deaminase n=2 Tax=Ectothiorhodosinus mongolicus TaxID=233100 RepID=A0A1R3VLW9_9GAMM|nr:5-methylthioadenosine/S-adenosylhomocysteine deaminase [Ectothiorhodosinus mongolicus]